MSNTIAIFGGSYGVGRAISVCLARKGFEICLFSSDPKGGNETVSRIESEGFKASLIETDLGSMTGIKLAAEQLEGLTGLGGLVYLASPTPDPDVEMQLINTEDSLIEQYFLMNGTAPALLLKSAQPKLAECETSLCVAIASDWALPNSNGPLAFSAAKTALAKIFSRFGAEGIKDGIKSTVIFPGDIASFDKDWEEPKWDIDSEISDVISEIGDERIPLQDLCKVIEVLFEIPHARVPEIHMAPVSEGYTF